MPLPPRKPGFAPFCEGPDALPGIRGLRGSLLKVSFKRQYLFNLFCHNSPIGPEGYNEEEMKMVRESHKIWNDDSPRITATCVRVPVLRAHCEAINLTFRNSR